MKDFNKINVVNLPLTPAKFVEGPTCISKNGYKIIGVDFKEYIIDCDNELFKPNNMAWVTLYTGEKKCINTSYIKSIIPCDIYVVSLKHENTNFNDNYREMYFRINRNAIIQLNDSYYESDDPNINNIEPFKVEKYNI